MSDCAVQNREALYRFPAGQLQVGFPRGCSIAWASNLRFGLVAQRVSVSLPNASGSSRHAL